VGDRRSAWPIIGGKAVNWIIDNKDWIFSGIGATLVVFIIPFVIRLFLKRDAQIEIVDVKISKFYIRPEEKGFPLGTYIDIKIRNKGDKVAFLSCVLFKVQEVFRLDDPGDVNYSVFPFTETYDITLKSVPKSTQKFEISQKVEANDVDRFRLKVVSEEDSGHMEVVYKFSLYLVYNENKKKAFAGKHLAAFPPKFTPKGWTSTKLVIPAWKSNYIKLTNILKKCKDKKDITISETFKDLIDGYEKEAKLSYEELISRYTGSIYFNTITKSIPKENWEAIDREIKAYNK
jgi:hypothetical protein